MKDLRSHKAHLQDYFNSIGFDRWSAIYDGESDLSSIRQSVREGHAIMLAQAKMWLMERHAGGKLLDAGCGTGLFSLQMARMGFDVNAYDIAPRMIAAASDAAQQAQLGDHIQFAVGDVEATTGTYDAVACFDVLIHYPQDAFATMCQHLIARTEDTLLLTYAPYNALLAAMHWVGGWFPSSQRRTEIQMIRDHHVDAILNQGGMNITRRERISQGFYHVVLLEATRR